MNKLDKLKLDEEGQEKISNLPQEFIEELAHLNEPIPNPIDEILSDNTEIYEDKRLNYLLFENPKILQLEENYKKQLEQLDDNAFQSKELSDSITFIERFPILKPIFNLK
jgi:hypothetical protein